MAPQRSRPARRRTGHRQGKHRHPRHPGTARNRRHRTHPSPRRPPRSSPSPQSRCRDLQQDHHAGVRDALLRRLHLPPAVPQPLEPRPDPRRLQRRCRRSSRRRLRPHPRRHRHRRLDPPPRRLVRRSRPQANPRPHSSRNSLPRQGNRPLDPYAGRRRARAGRHDRPRPPRPDFAPRRLGKHRDALRSHSRTSRSPSSSTAAPASPSTPRSPQPSRTRPPSSKRAAPPSSRSHRSSPARCSTASTTSGASVLRTTCKLSPEDRRNKVLPEIREWVSNAADYSPFEVLQGYSQIQVIATAVDSAFADYDFIISPVAPITAFPADLAYPSRDPNKPFEHIAFTLPYNMSAHPAASVNCGYSSTGLPIGLQIAAPRFNDEAAASPSCHPHRPPPNQTMANALTRP